MIMDLENEVIKMIIIENSKYSEKLMNQYINSEIINRTITGHGFFTKFNITANEYCLGDNINLALGNVCAKINQMNHGTGFVLFIRNGFISCLEGYAYDEAWPIKIDEFHLYYTNT